MHAKLEFRGHFHLERGELLMKRECKIGRGLYGAGLTRCLGGDAGTRARPGDGLATVLGAGGVGRDVPAPWSAVSAPAMQISALIPWQGP